MSYSTPSSPSYEVTSTSSKSASSSSTSARRRVSSTGSPSSSSSSSSFHKKHHHHHHHMAGPSSPASSCPSSPVSPVLLHHHHHHQQQQQLSQSEEFWVNAMIPVAKQPTHRKNDYATILSLLKSIDPNSALIKSVDDAENVERSIGSWFLVRGCERSVVKLGIGANPGLKKYYWRANSSKRLLKREMEGGSEEASLVYIIQKASPVSKRCASIPDTDIWLVMYLPATLRAASDAATRKVVGPSRRIPGPSVSAAAPFELYRKRREREEDSSPLSSPPSSPCPSSPERPTSIPPLPSLIPIHASPSSQSCSENAPIDIEATDDTVSDDVPVAESSLSAAADVAPSHHHQSSPKRQRSPKKIGPSHRAPAFSAVLPSESSDSLSSHYDSIFPVHPQSSYSMDNLCASELFSTPDPFLPLAGSQTFFSAAIEAACMSGVSAPWMTTPYSRDTAFDLSEFVF